jgi:stage V sporulation protein G
VEITEVRIKLMEDPHDRLQAFCSITLDGSFVIRDLKIIQGAKGSFVAMPSRKLTDRCPRCLTKNHLRALFCSQCGAKLDDERATRDTDGRAKLYADIAHPINSDCRELIQRKVIEAYEVEIVRSKEPGYICTYDDYGEDRYATLGESEEDYPVIRLPFEGSDRSRRVEPASRPGGPPHHDVGAPVGRTAQVSSAARNEDDGFGDGIV